MLSLSSRNGGKKSGASKRLREKPSGASDKRNITVFCARVKVIPRLQDGEHSVAQRARASCISAALPGKRSRRSLSSRINASGERGERPPACLIAAVNSARGRVSLAAFAAHGLLVEIVSPDWSTARRYYRTWKVF